MELALDDVTSGYGGIPIVREVSLEVGTGEIVAIVGRNGVGKTTLIETVAGLLPVMAGGIAFRGEDVTRADARDRARMGMGYVPLGRGRPPRRFLSTRRSQGRTRSRSRVL